MPNSALPRVLADGPLAADVLELLHGRATVVDWEAAPRSQSAGDADAIVAIYTYGHPRVDGELLDRLPAVKLISNYGVGVDHIDLDAARERKIPVANTPGILDGATADLGFALLLAASRRIVEGDRYARSAAFTRYDPSYMLGREAHGATLGIVGMGRIGRQVARRANGFDMRVLYHNRRRDEQAERELDATYSTFPALLAESDYVMLTVPLTQETRGLMNAAALRRMKPTATLINIARGPIVDTQALYEALAGGQIYSAAIDVTDPEPLPRDHPLLELSNLTILPHLGSATAQTRRRMAEMSVENLLRGLRGDPLLARVC
jgi:glyoxylate reductase